MTVLRREDVQSKVASWDGSPYRIVRSPILTIVPLIIRRLRGPSLTRVIDSLPLLHSCRRRYRCRLERRPEEARQLACDRHCDLGRWLVLFHQPSEAATQSLLRLVGNRNHAGRLAFASSCESDPDNWPVLINA